MRSLLLLCLGILFLAASCGSKSPKEFNAGINTINDSIKLKGEAWGAAFTSAMTTLNFSGLKPIREDIERYVDKSIEKVNGMKSSGGEELKEAELDYLRYEKQTVHEVFAPFENFTSATTYGDLEKATMALDAASTQEQAKIRKVQSTQQAFIEKNKIEAK
jgi:hypothetical protein